MNNELDGHFDSVSCALATGWARGPSADPVWVVIRDAEQVVARAYADRFREDLAAAGIGNGRHAFEAMIPLHFTDGRRHILTAVIEGTDFVLPGGPHVMEPTPLSQADRRGRFGFLADDFEAIARRLDDQR